MRVDMVSEHASPLAALGEVDAGGQNVHVAALADGLARRGVAVTVHTRRDDPALPAQVRLASGVIVNHIDAGPPRFVPKDELLPHMDDFAHRLTDRWQARPPDVVHGHFWMSGMAALAAATPLAIPVVQTFHALGTVKRRHQGALDTSPAGRIALERLVMAGADRIVATCSNEVFELVREGADPHRISVVPCGVDLDRFHPGPTGAPPRPRIACIGRLVERKGIDDVVRALAELPGVELVIAGGPERARLTADPDIRRLRRLAEGLGVADRITFTGGLDRAGVAALMGSVNAVVCAAHYEPFGIVPLEAMASGVPVIASAVGGMIDTVVAEETGLHVAPGDVTAIGRAVARILHEPGLAVRLGAAGARRARERYAWPRAAAATLAVYRGVVAADRRLAGVRS